MIIDFGFGAAAKAALDRDGRPVTVLEMAMADKYVDDPDALSRRIGSHLGRGVPLVFAFGAGPDSSATACDWEATVHLPLARCFTFVRALAPIVRENGGDCVALLPVDAILPDGARGAAATLHRALLGLFEALRAENIDSDMRACILFVEPEQDVQDLTRRLEMLLARRGMYSLPPTIDEAILAAQCRAMMMAAEATVRAPDFPQPPTPMGMVYAREIEECRSV